MIFGYSTNAYVRFSLEESFKKIAALGFNGVEIMCDRPHLYPPDYSSPDISRLIRCLKETGLKVTNLNSFTLFAVGDTYLPSWIEPEKARRNIRIQHTLDCLNLARDLGCTNISIPPGGPLENMDRNEAFRLFYEGLDQVIPTAESLKIRLLIEPEPNLLLERTREFQEFIKPIQSPWVGLNFDIGHFFCAGENPSDAFETLFHLIGHVHIEDIAGTRVHQHLIAGLGVIDFPEIFQRMTALNYAGDISLELYPYVDMPDEAGEKSRSHLLPLMRDAGLPL
ncbi:MAG: sugar phosphate isomerase/epimerase family protein [Desulfatirhabdiaceae bacterium]